jgi:hypothetical protein
MSNQIDNERD